MNKATLIKKCDSGFNGDARLYRCEGGSLPEYVIVSAVNIPREGPETYIFTANGDGEVTDWMELPGSYKGAMDHELALRNAGYCLTVKA